MTACPACLEPTRGSVGLPALPQSALLQVEVACLQRLRLGDMGVVPRQAFRWDGTPRPAHPCPNPHRSFPQHGSSSEEHAAPGSSAALIRMDKRVTSFAGTHHGSGMDWESEPEHVDKHVPLKNFRAVGMSDEDWNKDELDVGYHPTRMPDEELPPYHPTAIVADKPPQLEEEQIEGVQGALQTPVLAPDKLGKPSQTTLEHNLHQEEDDAFAAERHYGNPEDADDDLGDNDVVVEETYYEGDKEELDYDDNVQVKEDMATNRADDKGDATEDDGADVTEGDEAAVVPDNDASERDKANVEEETIETVDDRDEKKKRAPVWG